MHGANLGTLLRRQAADRGGPLGGRGAAARYTSPQDRQYLPGHDPAFDVVYAVRPRSAMAWRLDDYAASQRRWTALS